MKQHQLIGKSLQKNEIKSQNKINIFRSLPYDYIVWQKSTNPLQKCSGLVL